MYWPKIDQDVERMIKSCDACLENRVFPGKIGVEWPKVEKPWARVHADHLFLKNKNFLIMKDSYSKWIEVFPVRDLSSEETIRKFRETMSRFGIMEVLVTDNGTAFTSRTMQEFLKGNGVHHITSPPFSPQSNGAAENSVKIFKTKLKTALEDQKNTGVELETLMNRFLLNYRSTKHAKTNETPAKLFLNRELRTRISQLSEKNDRIEKNSQQEKGSFSKKIREFRIGEKIIARNYDGRRKWVQGIIEKRLGSTVYVVLLKDGRRWKRHINQLGSRSETENFSEKLLEQNRNWIDRQKIDRTPYLESINENRNRVNIEERRNSNDNVENTEEATEEQGENESETESGSSRTSRASSAEFIQMDLKEPREKENEKPQETEGESNLSRGERKRELPKRLWDFYMGK